MMSQEGIRKACPTKWVRLFIQVRYFHMSACIINTYVHQYRGSATQQSLTAW